MRRPISQNRDRLDLRAVAQRWAVRLAFWGLVVLLALGLAGGVLLGLHRWLVTHNRYFTLRRISLEGNRSLTEQTVRQRLEQAGAVVGGSNLMRLSVRALREGLERDPLISRAEVVRRIPDLLQVSVVERTPIASIRGRAPFLVDEEGVVLPWRDVSRERLLPGIAGVRPPARLVPGEKVQDEALRGAVRLLRLLARRADGSNYDVELVQLDYLLPSLRLHLRPRGTFVEGAIVIVPVQGMEEALDRLRDIHRIRTAAGKTTTKIDVTYRRNVPVEP
jgi:cell division septal protein FtsQ